MEYSIQKLGKSEIEIAFDVSKEEWSACINEAYQKNKHKYKLDGFRAGKIPMHVLETRFGKEVFFEDAIDIALPKYYSEILEKEKELEPMGRPEVDIKEVSAEGLKVVLQLITKPTFELAPYKGLIIAKESTSVSTEEIDAAVNRSRESLARFVEVADRPVQDGDEIVLDYSGSLDGVKFDGGTAEKQTLVIGSHSFIEGFEEQMIGMAIGESKDLNLKFPENYGASELAGKDVVFAVKVHSIKVKELPELDDELAKDISDFATLAEYKDDLRAKLEANKAKSAQYKEDDKLIDAIVSATEIDIPELLIMDELEHMIKELEGRMMSQGIKLEDYLKYSGSTIETLKEQRKDDALRNVKTRLVLEELIKKESFNLTAEEMDAKVTALAEGNNKSLEEYKKEMNEQQFNSIANEIIMDKLFAFLRENNTIA